MLDLSEKCANVYPLHGVYIFNTPQKYNAIALCAHDFDSVIETHEAPNQHQQGFWLQFHCYEPWKEKAWELESVEELIELLQQGCVHESIGARNSLTCWKLIEFLKSALANNLQVTIEYKWGGV